MSPAFGFGGRAWASYGSRRLVGIGAAVALAFGAMMINGAVARAEPPITVAAAGTVRMLQSNSMTPRARRCLTRVREELASGGFEVTVSEFGTGDEGLWMVEPPRSHGAPNATIALIGDPDNGAAELWIVEGVPWDRVVLRRQPIPPGAGPHDDEVLAIRALEFLRASALDLAGGPRPSTMATGPIPPDASPPSATIAAEPGRPVTPPGDPSQAVGPVSFELGLASLQSPGNLTSAFLPVARARVEWLSIMETRLTLAGLGSQPRVTSPEGTATVGQAEGLLELRTAFRHGRAIRPVLGAGAGVLRVNVEGDGKGAYEGLHGQRWVGLFDLSAGFTARLGGSLSVAVELHGQLAAPYATVNFLGQEVARIARPAVFSSVTLVVPL